MPVKTTRKEQRLLKMYEQAGHTVERVERRSPREFDLEVAGTSGGCRYVAWLVLGAIRRFTRWTSPDVAAMTDYPAMAGDGDWSGVRDTDEERLWAIFERFVLPKVA